MNKLRPTKLSISAVEKAHSLGKDFLQAYLFVRQLASQSKHPIILNYKQQITSTRNLLGLTDYKFRKLLNLCKTYDLVKVEGNHLRLHSTNQDWKFKPTKRNDYRHSSNPKKFALLVILRQNTNKQVSSIRKKEKPNTKRVHNSGLSLPNETPNHYVTASVRAVSKMLHTKSLRTAHQTLQQLKKENLISITNHKKEITKEQCKQDLKSGKRNIRKINGKYFRCHYVIGLNYTMKRTEYQPYYKLSEQQQIAYLEQGYSIESINRLLA